MIQLSLENSSSHRNNEMVCPRNRLPWQSAFWGLQGTPGILGDGRGGIIQYSEQVISSKEISSSFPDVSFSWDIGNSTDFKWLNFFVEAFYSLANVECPDHRASQRSSQVQPMHLVFSQGCERGQVEMSVQIRGADGPSPLYGAWACHLTSLGASFLTL